MLNRHKPDGNVDYSGAFVELAQRLRCGERNVARAILDTNAELTIDTEFAIDLVA